MGRGIFLYLPIMILYMLRIQTDILRCAYIRRADGTDRGLANFVLCEGWEIGIVRSDCPTVAAAISALLCSVLDKARNTAEGGHLPAAVVQRIQENVISPTAVAQLWGQTGYRFVLTRSVDAQTHELLATMLVAKSVESLFFFTGAYNNLLQSRLKEQIDLSMPHPNLRDMLWFSQFDFPDLGEFKPSDYHQIANFAVSLPYQAKGLGRLLLQQIQQKYAASYLSALGREPLHGQPLLSGRGLWQIGDPPWLLKMRKLGFYLRAGAESFFIEQAGAPLPAIFAADGHKIDNVEYNRSFGLPQLYEGWQPNHSREHLMHRIAKVQRLAVSPHAKLQYFQTLFDFVV